ncbi:MAG: SRPBCC family protein [Gemmatimonas sp.]
MYWILLVMGLVVSVVVATLVGGMVTPRKHVAARTIVLRAAPDKVWALVRTVKEYPNWREEILSVEESAGNDHRPAWTEIGRQKSLSYIATTDEPPTRFTARILDDDLGYSGEWQHVITPVADGTRLTITEQGEVGNLIFRFVGTHFLGHTRSIDAFLRDVALEFGELAKPESV